MMGLATCKDSTNVEVSSNKGDFSGALKIAARSSCRLQAFPATENKLLSDPDELEAAW
jgi:hypothetical protein